MKISRLLSLLLSLVLPLSAVGESLPSSQQVAPHSYAWIGPYGPPSKENGGFRMNLGFVVGSEAVAVIDSGYGDDMAREMLGQIARVTDRPVRYVINTNSQPHRILGNAVFKQQGAEIIAAEDALARITGEGQTMASTAEGILSLPSGRISPPGKPDRILKGMTELDLGGVVLNLIPVGTAHTSGSMIVEVRQDDVVFAGDLLYGGRLLAVLPVSRVDKWIHSFERLRTFDNTLMVPGHGDPGKIAEFEHSTYTYLKTLQTHMDAAIDRGTDLQDAIRGLDQSPWQGLADYDALAGRNAHQTFIEREAAAFE